MSADTESDAPPMYQWATDLFPIHRSLTGEGVRETLRYLKGLLPDLIINEVPSGTKAFDWTVPKEWVIREAYFDYFDHERGVRFCNVKDNNLQVVQYSAPFEGIVSREELDKHLHSLPEQPDAIPYVTSYYKERWGFCISHRQRQALPEGQYHVHIDSELKDGSLTIGQLVLPGKEQDEVLLSTYVCHPSMANNELSGPVVVAALAQWLASQPRRYTYRILFVPETIGALVWLSSRHVNLIVDYRPGPPVWMAPEIIAGFQVTCVGDEREYGYLPSRKGDTLADRAAQVALDEVVAGELGRTYQWWSYLQRGSDERQYCAPGIDLPVCSIMRSRYDTYPEYHTSLDDLSLISQAGLEGSLKVYQRAIEIIEANKVYKTTVQGEPQLGKRGLYPEQATEGRGGKLAPIFNILAYADGTRDVISLAETIGCDTLECARICETLVQHELLRTV